MMIAALLLAAQLSPFDQVVASERAFAAASLQTGLHESFLANLAPDAISFMPLPVPARPVHEGKPPASGKLNWGPTWVAVSSAGDLALSTGLGVHLAQLASTLLLGILGHMLMGWMPRRVIGEASIPQSRRSGLG